ncbi:MAG: transketolase [Candidatus Omnitrophica bacterium]|nr:transketolase [Candidatus Omnitrophota bacterium]
MRDDRIQELRRFSNEMRKDIIRMLAKSKSGHPGGSLSIIDILTVLYYEFLRHDPKRPHWEDRDRVILSKGHAAPALYAVLAHTGYFPRETLLTLRTLGSILQGHPDQKRTPGIEASTGSLGQGLSIAIGCALAAQVSKKDFYTYVILSDGECNEGQTWEAVMSAAFRKVDNLTAIVDLNAHQLDGSTKEILNMDPVPDKWKSFGWAAQEIDGHDYRQIIDALSWARSVHGKPTVILARTVKGKGISFMENNNHYHGVAPTPDEAEKALAELEAKTF